jgi:methylmalonyl-CoA/ethylmalonyl-CoA epimerase
VASTDKTIAEVGNAISTVLRGATLHHIGFVVQSIARTAQEFADAIGAHWDAKVIYDPLQQVRVTFISRGAPAPLIELIEPAETKSPVSNFVSAGGGLHHLCYEVAALDDELRFARSVGNLVVKRPLPAVAFGGRRIAWVFTRQKLLLEYLEATLESVAATDND